MLTQEPWCFTPEEIARLTDWQIEELYYKPAKARQEQMEKERMDRSTSEVGHEPAVLPTVQVSDGPRRGSDGCTVTEGHGWRKFSWSSDDVYPDGLDFSQTS